MWQNQKCIDPASGEYRFSVISGRGFFASLYYSQIKLLALHIRPIKCVAKSLALKLNE